MQTTVKTAEEMIMAMVKENPSIGRIKVKAALPELSDTKIRKILKQIKSEIIVKEEVKEEAKEEDVKVEVKTEETIEKEVDEIYELAKTEAETQDVISDEVVKFYSYKTAMGIEYRVEKLRSGGFQVTEEGVKIKAKPVLRMLCLSHNIEYKKTATTWCLASKVLRYLAK